MHKKKAKVVVIGKKLSNAGDAGSGKSTLVQAYAKKNYQFSSDYTLVHDHLCRLKAQKFTPK